MSLRVTMLLDDVVHVSRTFSECPAVGDHVEIGGDPRFPRTCVVVRRIWKAPVDDMFTPVDVILERLPAPKKKGKA